MTGRPSRHQSVLIFHGIGTPARTLEDGEARFWLTRDHFCTLLDQIADMGPAAPVITFDDGNSSDLDIALPELQARGLTAIFFLLTKRLEHPGSLTRSGVRALAKAGQTIGLHGHAHRDWRALDQDARLQEYRTARHSLADLADAPITLAATPFGLYNRQVMRDLADAGFEALYTSDWGRADAHRFLRPRNCIDNQMHQGAIQDALGGRVALARRPRRLMGLARKRLLPVWSRA